MKFGYSKIIKARDAFSVRIAVITSAIALLFLIIGASSGLITQLHTTVGLPIDFKVRQLLEVTPPVSPKIKIISLDDSTYAYIRKPYLTGEDWAQIFRAIGSAQPRVIVTTHMFGTGEFDTPGNPLSTAIRTLKRNGTDVVVGSFAYPLKISFRKPIGIDRPEFQIPKSGIAMSELPGWTLYGPDADHAQFFSGIGHLSYDGEARMSGYQKISDHIAVPHVSLLTANILGIDTIPSIDNTGRFLVNLPEISHLMKASKSLKFLLGVDGSEWAQKTIEQGDIVLLLNDMYTGKVSFVGTPLGPTPSGYVVASALNSAILGDWLVDNTDCYAIVAIFLFLGITCGMAPNISWFFLSIGGGTVLIPILGLLTFAVTGGALPWLVSTIFFTIPAGVVFSKRTHTRLLQIKSRNLQIEKETEKLNAIVRTAQMFAHDVRKPFSMLNMTAQSIQKITDTSQIIKFMNRMLPELDRSMSAVEGMIQDIMEIDSKGSLTKESTQIELFLAECLREVFILRHATEISIRYDLRHTHEIDIDKMKIKRVIVNIVDNALQAMTTKGNIWITTCDVLQDGASFVEMTIGNSGTWIKPESIDRIFEAFYTSGKKGGTGLGLAIAQKVVQDHGGSISARSNQTNGTEFLFTLPIAQTTPSASSEAAALPSNSADFITLPFIENNLESPEEMKLKHEQTYARLVELKKTKGRPIKILVIDDEPVYLESMKTILSGGVFEPLIESHTADSGASAIISAKTFAADLILCDIDMGPMSLSGFEIVEQLRLDGIGAYIVMHSNRVFQLDSLRAADVGANCFLPKPINELRLMSVIIEGLESAPKDAVPPEDMGDGRDVVVVVDDDIFTLDAWETILDDATLKTFASPDKFWEYLAANKSFINNIKLIITDYYFDNDGEETGESFAIRLKEIGSIPVVLSSNGTFSSLPEVFDATIGKEPDTYRSIKEKIRKTG